MPETTLRVRSESLHVCPSDGRSGPHNFVPCAPFAPAHAFACSSCGAAIERGTLHYIASCHAARAAEPEPPVTREDGR